MSSSLLRITLLHECFFRGYLLHEISSVEENAIPHGRKKEAIRWGELLQDEPELLHEKGWNLLANESNEDNE